MVVNELPSVGGTVGAYELDADETHYSVFVARDPQDPDYVLVMFDHGTGHGTWARLRRTGFLSPDYVAEKFDLPSAHQDNLTRLIRAALGR